jgi:tripartite-type tricarboxylate transporter receptor subunit TctC
VKDVLSGEVPVLFTTIGTVAALLQAGKLRGLAVTSEHRTAAFPALPTVAEAGYPGFDITTWLGIAAPAGTPRRIIVRLHDELVRILADPDVRGQLAAFGMEPLGDTPEQFASALNADARRWAQLIRADGAPTQ